MAERADNFADPPPWADTETDEVIGSGTIGPVDPDVLGRLAERDGDEAQPEAT
jgi:hypothetical protein